MRMVKPEEIIIVEVKGIRGGWVLDGFFFVLGLGSFFLGFGLFFFEFCVV